MAYDPKCQELAEHFLPGRTTREAREQLAQHIQDEIEFWFDVNGQDMPSTGSEEYPDLRAYPLADNH